MTKGATTLQRVSKAIRRAKHSGCLSYGLERKRDSPSHIDPVIAGFIDELNNGRIPPTSPRRRTPAIDPGRRADGRGQSRTWDTKPVTPEDMLGHKRGYWI
jgi:hypothetical protein